MRCCDVAIRGPLRGDFRKLLFTSEQAAFEPLNRTDLNAIKATGDHGRTLCFQPCVTAQALIEINATLRIWLDRDRVGGKGSQEVHADLAAFLRLLDSCRLLVELLTGEDFNAVVGTERENTRAAEMHPELRWKRQTTLYVDLSLICTEEFLHALWSLLGPVETPSARVGFPRTPTMPHKKGKVNHFPPQIPFLGPVSSFLSR